MVCITVNLEHRLDLGRPMACLASQLARLILQHSATIWPLNKVYPRA